MITSKPSRRSATHALPAMRGERCSRAAAVSSQSSEKRDSTRPRSPLHHRHLADSESGSNSVPIETDPITAMTIKISALEAAVRQLVNVLTKRLRSVARQNYYTTEQFAVATNGRLKPDTVQQYCREGRLIATKTISGRGGEREWRLSHTELRRYESEGLVPLEPKVRRDPPCQVR